VDQYVVVFQHSDDVFVSLLKVGVDLGIPVVLHADPLLLHHTCLFESPFDLQTVVRVTIDDGEHASDVKSLHFVLVFDGIGTTKVQISFLFGLFFMIFEDADDVAALSPEHNNKAIQELSRINKYEGEKRSLHSCVELRSSCTHHIL
jgi:hypothetical protein